MGTIGVNVTLVVLRVPHFEHHCQTLGQGWKQAYNQAKQVQVLYYFFVDFLQTKSV